MNASQTISISRTGYSKSFGTARYKTVSGLSAADKAAIANGDTVLIANCPGSVNGVVGVTYRQVYRGTDGRYYHRLPAPETLAALAL